MISNNYKMDNMDKALIEVAWLDSSLRRMIYILPKHNLLQASMFAIPSLAGRRIISVFISVNPED